MRTADGVEHELDVLVFATGFDAVDGNYRSMDLRGRGGRHIDEHWADGPDAATWACPRRLPEHVHDPRPERPVHQPAAEHRVAGRVDQRDSSGTRNATGSRTVEPTREAEDGWTKTCEEIANMTLFPKVESWIFGANIPGKKNTVMFYMAGIGAYRQQLEAVRNDGYKGFVFS